MRIAICEDESTYLDTLSRIVRQWSLDNGQPIELYQFSNAEVLLAEIEDGTKFDLAFLDIQLPEMNGMDLAAEWRKWDMGVTIVFATSFLEFMSRGFEVRAYRYLRKPVRESECIKILNDVYELQKRKMQGDLVVQLEGMTVSIPKTDIVYAEADSHHVMLYLRDGQSHRIRKKLTDLEKDLAAPIFIRCHRGLIVNVMFVHCILRNEVKLQNNVRLMVSENKWALLNRCFLAVHAGNALAEYQIS